MALDFGILQPIDIAGQIASGRQEAQRNQLAQQQLSMGGLQQQKAELELNDFKRRQAALDQFVQDAEKNNKSGSEEDMLNSYGQYARAIGDPTHIMHHQELTMALKERQRYNQEQMGGRQQPPSAAPSPAAGPSAPIDEAMKMDYVTNAPAGVSYEDFAASQNTGLAKPVAARTPVVTAPLQAPGMTPAPQINNLPAAAAPVASVNQLGMSPAQLQAKIDELGFQYPKGTAKGKIAILTKQLEDANKVHVIDNNLVNGAGQIIATIPKTITPSELERFLVSSDLTPEQQKQAKRDWINKQTTHQPATSVDVKVNAFTPASEEAQRDFIKSTRATYDTLKNAPATIKNIEEAKRLIPGAKGFMGPGGESLLDAASFLNSRLGTKIDTKGVKDATELRSRLFQGIIENLRKLDANPTENQQNAMRTALGNVGTDPNALPAVLDSFADTVRSKVEMHNNEVSGAVAKGVKFPYDPTIKLPSPITPNMAGPKIGTEKDGYRFKGGNPADAKSWEKM